MVKQSAHTAPEDLTLARVSEADWPALSGGFADLTYEQSLTYARAAAERIGAEARFVRIDDRQGKAVAAACLRIKTVPGLGRGIAWIAAGPMLSPRAEAEAAPSAARIAAVLSALRAHARQTGHVLRLRFPAVASAPPEAMDALARDAGFLTTPRAPRYRTVLINCAQDEDSLMRAMHGKWRNPLRNALKAGLSLEVRPFAEAAPRFDALYREVQAAKGFDPDIPPEFYARLSGPDFGHDVLFARHDGRDMGAMTIGTAGQNAVYLFGATAEAGRRLNTGHYLMWQAMLHCRNLGLRRFDLGGIDPEANPGVTQFKRRSGGAEIAAAGPYEYRPPGLGSALIGAAEALHARLRRGRG